MDKIIEPTLLQKKFSSLLPKVVLASSSPNRRKLIEDGGTTVSVFTPECEECKGGMKEEEVVGFNARVKLEAYLSSPHFDPTLPAISADTLVHIGGSLLGKPRDEKDAREMMELLSGKRQSVLSGCGLYIPGREPIYFTDTASVVFYTLTPSTIDSYLALKEWKGAAGGYRLQKNGWRLVERIEGDWTTVVGLPMERIIEAISR